VDPLLVLLVLSVAVIAVLVLGNQSFRDKTRAACVQEAQALLEEWRARDLGGLREQQLELARKDAQVQLEQWKMQATQEAIVQLETWRTTELESTKAQQFETARTQVLAEFDHWKLQFEGTIRQDAIQRSQGVTLGKITEHFVPYLPDFTFNPKDARFLGSPIDFVVFDGLSEGQLRAIIFVEVKTGKGQLSTRERRIRDAVTDGAVEWVEVRPSFDMAPVEGVPLLTSAPDVVDDLLAEIEQTVLTTNPLARPAGTTLLVRTCECGAASPPSAKVCMACGRAFPQLSVDGQPGSA